MKAILLVIFSNDGILRPREFDKSLSTRLGWFNGDKEAIERVDKLLARAGLSAADVAAQSLANKR